MNVIQETLRGQSESRSNVYLNFEYRFVGRNRTARSGMGITINVGQRGALLLMPADGLDAGRVLELKIKMDALYMSALQEEWDAPFRGGGADQLPMWREMRARVVSIQPLDQLGFLGGNYTGVAIAFDDGREEPCSGIGGKEGAAMGNRVLSRGSVK